jgi:hypothetical protein
MGSRRFQRCVPSTPGVGAAVPLEDCVGMTTSVSRIMFAASWEDFPNYGKHV